MKRLCIKCRKEPALIEPGPEGHPICRGVCASCRRIIESGDLQTVHEILDSLHAPILLLHSRRYFSITTERLDDFILLRLDKVQLAGINKGNRPPPMSWAAHSCGLAPTPSPAYRSNSLPWIWERQAQIKCHLYRNAPSLGYYRGNGLALELRCNTEEASYEKFQSGLE